MYLKKIELRGFKTFADRTELEFGPGITAIVGPNGTGKSNISDAICWALGEQSNRALRTEASQDIIFAGSEKRRPLGMSEVAITIDNTDQRLAVEYNEVIVSRRLFRSGDSEYLLNRSTVRRRDIRDLLLDTGVGPGAYSVIGQGEIDAILSIRSEDRRELLEEVAGIRKYRFRRDEATRKLDATEANVTRVADIVAELSSQRKPLEQQAEIARQYQEYADRLRELDLHLLAGDFQRRRQRIGKVANEIEITRADLQGTQTQISTLDAAFEKMQFDLAKMADEVDRLRDEATKAERELDQSRQAQALAQERLRAAQSRKADLTGRIEGQKNRRDDLVSQRGKIAQEFAEVDTQVSAATREKTELDAQLAEKSKAFQEKMRNVRELEKQQSEQLNRAKALENEAMALQSLETDLADRAERLSRQSEALATRQLEIADSLTEAIKRRDELASGMTQHQQSLEQTRATLKQSNRILQEHRQKCNVFSGAVSSTETRQKMLDELVRSREGFSDGARAATQAAEAGKLTGVLGIVADLLDVPARFGRAFEAALGDTLQWVVTENEEQAVAGARYLQTAESGRATFAPLTAVAGFTPTEITNLAEGQGVLGLALKHVRYRPEHQKLIQSLLQDVVIVRDLDSALNARQRSRSRIRYVTLAGEIVEPDGQITAGGKEGAGTQAFVRRQELETVTAELEVMRDALAKMWKCEEELEVAGAKISEEIQATESELSKMRSQHAAAQSDSIHLADQQKAARRAEQELSEEAENLSSRLDQARTRRETAATESEKQRLAGNKVGEQVQEARRTGVGQAEVDELRARQVNAQVRVAELTQKRTSGEQLRQRYTQEFEKLTQELTATEKALAEAIAHEETMQAELAKPGSVDIAALEQTALTARATVNDRSKVLSELREKAAELEAMRSRLNAVAQEQNERMHRSELALAREEAQCDAIVERLQDAYGLSPDEAFAERYQDVSETEIRREADVIREAIRKLGPVNLSSIDECERLTAREEFLNNQLADLESARQDLLKVIAEIDDAATEEFIRTFVLMQEEFQIMFERLFGGGRTELKLTNPDSPLDSGVDVIVQVPGKRQQNLLLLSGGERALTAMALLFAMLRVRPTPFCVMDEIDAALDEANVGRFVSVLREFTEHSQFIIVTHNPSTIEAADTLFGVTMQEPGVSKLLRLELRNWENFLAEAEDQVAQTRTPRAGSRVLPSSS